MKKIVRLIMSRLFISVILIFFQLILIFAIFSRVINDAFWAQIFTYISFFLCLWVVFHKQEPEYIIGWVLIIMILPLYGSVFYVLFGKKPLNIIGKKRIACFLKNYTNSLNEMPLNPKEPSKALKNFDSDLFRQSRYISRASYSPVWADTEVNYFASGDSFFPVFLEELKKAEKFIFIEFFILAKGEMWNKILEILENKLAEGVEIKILYDDFGSFGRIPGNYDKILEGMGFQAKAFNPIKPHLNVRMNYRDHRKICVIDGNIGFTGGLNLADEYINREIRFGHWKDTAVQLKGDAVWNFTTMFLAMWNFETGNLDNISLYKPTEKYLTDGFIQPFGDNPLDDIAMAENAYTQIINMAKNYVWITTPYLVINRSMLSALCIAAESGVDVRIVLPKMPDKFEVHEVSKSYYLQLIKAGVKIYEYIPGFIHSKMFVSDDKVAIIGTINMDYRSFYLHFECGVAIYGSSIIRTLEKDMERTFELSQRITYKDAKNVPVFKKGFRMVLRLLSPLL